jgi:hypothetical protein
MRQERSHYRNLRRCGIWVGWDGYFGSGLASVVWTHVVI